MVARFRQDGQFSGASNSETSDRVGLHVFFYMYLKSITIFLYRSPADCTYRNKECQSEDTRSQGMNHLYANLFGLKRGMILL